MEKGLSSILDKRIRPHLLATNGSWKDDEAYCKIKGAWRYLYRAIDSEGKTLNFTNSIRRDAKEVKRFFDKVLGESPMTMPRMIKVDKNTVHPSAVDELSTNLCNKTDPIHQ